MISNKASDGPTTGGSVHVNLLLTEAPDSPVRGCQLIKHGISYSDLSSTMPIIAVGLDDEFGGLEHEVGLEASKHSLMHLEMEPTFLELVIEREFDGCHFPRASSPQACLAYLLSCLRRMCAANPHFVAKHGLAHLLPCFRTPTPQSDLVQTLKMIGGSLIDSRWHLSNYNTPAT